MASEQHLLFGILAYQNGLITREQLLTAVDQWLEDKTRNIDRTLLCNQAISADEVRLLQDLMEKLLLKQSDLDSLNRTLGSDTDSLFADLRSRGDEDIYSTIGPAISPPVEPRARHSEKARSDGPRFKILRPHDEGGLGKVSVALDTELDREVALKEIKPHYADDAISRSRFLLEAEITGGLEHPGIVPIYSLGATADGRPYYAMRFIKGDNLAIAIKQFHENTSKADRSVARRRLLGRFLDICNAVYYAHQRGVLHRDLKPGNIMLGEYGETLVVDWGLAKPMEQAEPPNVSDVRMDDREAPLQPRSGSAVDTTLLGSVIGSPHYMSPEQACGENDRLGPTTDVYSLGATLYTLLTNCKPVAGESIQEILENVRIGKRLTARQQLPRVDIALGAICDQAMALDPNDRYPSVRQLANDIECYLADEPVQAYPEPWIRRTQRWVRKHPRVIGSLTATLVAGIVSAATIAGVVTHSNRLLGEKNVKLAELNENLVASRKKAIAARDEAVKARDEAREVLDFLIAAFRSPDPGISGRQLTVVQLLDDAILGLENRFEGAPTTKAALLDALGSTYLGLGLHHEAIRLCSVALKLRQEYLGLDDEQTLSSMNNLALVYLMAGHSDKALVLFNKALKLKRAKPDTDPQDTLTSMNNLAVAYFDAGNPDKAFALQKEALRIARDGTRGDPIGTMMMVRNIASFYRERGFHDKALALHKEAYDQLCKMIGENHPQTLIALNNLANCYHETGNTEKALELLETTSRLRHQKLGADHPSTLSTMNDLAMIYNATGQHQKALTLHKETHKRMRKVLGMDHPKTLIAMDNLALGYFKIGQYAKSLKLSEEAFMMAQKKLGNDHPTTLQIMLNVGRSYAALKRQQDAHALFETAYQLAQKKLGNVNSTTIMALRELAGSHKSLGNMSEALELYKTNLRHCQAELGEEHTYTRLAMSTLATVYFEQNKHEQSAELVEKLFPRSRSTVNTSSDPLSEILKLALSYQRLNKHAAACSLLEKTYRNYLKKFGEMDNRTGKVALEYRNALLLANETTKVLELCQNRMEAERKSGEKYLIHNRAAMAAALLAAGKLDDAIRVAKESFANIRAYSPSDSVFWWTNSILGSAYAKQGKWKKANQYLRQAESTLPSEQFRSVFNYFDWHRAHRIYHDLAYVHHEWKNSTEREKWYTALAEFDAQRAKLDPLTRGEHPK